MVGTISALNYRIFGQPLQGIYEKTSHHLVLPVIIVGRLWRTALARPFDDLEGSLRQGRSADFFHLARQVWLLRSLRGSAKFVCE